MECLLPGQYYHICNHANGDENLFREDRNYYYFLQKYHQHIDPIAETIAWCLMPNHFHLLVKIKQEEALLNNEAFSKFESLDKLDKQETINKLSLLVSKSFSNFFSSYTQSYNKVYKRKGSLFLKNFKRKSITSFKYFQALVMYIHLNPVKHGFINDIELWKWTSFFTFWEQQPTIAQSLFKDKETFIMMHNEKQQSFAEYSSIESDIFKD